MKKRVLEVLHGSPNYINYVGFGFLNCCIWIFNVYFENDFSSTQLLLGWVMTVVLRRFVTLPNLFLQNRLSTTMSLDKTSPMTTV